MAARPRIRTETVPMTAPQTITRINRFATRRVRLGRMPLIFLHKLSRLGPPRIGRAGAGAAFRSFSFHDQDNVDRCEPCRRDARGGAGRQQA